MHEDTMKDWQEIKVSLHIEYLCNKFIYNSRAGPQDLRTSGPQVKLGFSLYLHKLSKEIPNGPKLAKLCMHRAEYNLDFVHTIDIYFFSLKYIM